MNFLADMGVSMSTVTALAISDITSCIFARRA
jgi:hypothetical protein